MKALSDGKGDKESFFSRQIVVPTTVLLSMAGGAFFKSEADKNALARDLSVVATKVDSLAQEVRRIDGPSWREFETLRARVTALENRAGD